MTVDGSREAILNDDRPCLRCGYNLRGTSTAGVCPECGSPVVLSLRGNLLRYSSPEFLAILHRGVFLVQAAIIAQVLITIATLGATMVAIGSAPGTPRLSADIGRISSTLNTGASLLATLGWWLLSWPDPAYVGSDDGSTARKVVRATVAARAAALAVVAVVGSANLPGIMRGATITPRVAAVLTFTLISGLAWIVWYFAAMRYLRWLAPRLPNAKVDQRARLLTWLGPVLYVFGCGIGQLVGLVMYYNLLDWVRKDLKAIRLVAGAEVAALSGAASGTPARADSAPAASAGESPDHPGGPGESPRR